jgi:hypothetical protein
VVTAALARTVTLPEEMGGGTHEVRPPLFGEAATLLAFLGPEADEADRALAEPMLRAWLTEPVFEAARVRPEIVEQLLYAGVRIEAAASAKPAPGQDQQPGESQKARLDTVLARYCAGYGADPWMVWERVPFGFVLEMSSELEAVRAADMLDAIRAASVPHLKPGAQRKELSRLLRQALGRRPLPKPAPTGPSPEAAPNPAADKAASDALAAEVLKHYGKPAER